jgi:hypothetical protein
MNVCSELNDTVYDDIRNCYYKIVFKIWEKCCFQFMCTAQNFDCNLKVPPYLMLSVALQRCDDGLCQ